MNKKEINREFNVEKVEKAEGQFRNDNGDVINFRSYYVYIKAEDSPLVMRAKIDKVFNDYVEGDDYAAAAE